MLKQIIKLIWHIVWQRIVLRFRQFLKFCLVGTLGAIIDIGGLYVLVEFAGVHYLAGAAISFTLAVINNYFLNKYWTFQNKSKNHAKQFTCFLLVSIGGLLINLGIMYLLVEVFLAWYLLAKIMASIIVLFWNFLMNKHVTFRQP